MPNENNLSDTNAKATMANLINDDMDFEIRSLDSMCINDSQQQHPWWYNFKYLTIGIVFGIVFVKAEIISWFRIQEMFRLQSFHMFGVIGTAVVVGMISVALIKKFSINPKINANFGLYVVILHKYNINHPNIQYEKTKSNLNDFIIIYEKNIKPLLKPIFKANDMDFL